MFLNIITPCSRPENLEIIYKSINIPIKNYRWIVVFDELTLPTTIPKIKTCEFYNIKNVDSVYGNAQRNLALDLVISGYIYFNDDDTTIHPNLWEEIKNLNGDFISFQQANKDGSLRLRGDNINIGYIDSHNFILSVACVKNIKWILNRYDADGLFATECFKQAKQFIHIPKILSIYNSLK